MLLIRKIFTWLVVAAGVFLVAIGIIPLTPLVFLLVFVKVDPLWFLDDDFRLKFWQTQLIGACLAAAGIWLIRRSLRSLAKVRERPSSDRTASNPKSGLPGFETTEQGSD